jgi:hypothetical protein
MSWLSLRTAKRHAMGVKFHPLIVSCIFAFAAGSLSASTLMFDFGPTVPDSTEDLTNSPYHTVNGDFKDTSWNIIGTGGGSPGGTHVYSDGTAATGITLYRGTLVTDDTDVNFGNINWQGSIGNSLTGGGTGILSGSSVGRDGIYGPLVTDAMVGVKVQGLALGTYDVYVVGWNTAGSDPRSFYIGLTVNGNTVPDGGRYMDPTGFASASVTNDIALNITNWVQGENYAKFTITTTEETPAIAILSGVGTGSRAYLNAIQIVAVPEPGAAVLFLLSGASVLVLRRKRTS